MLEATLFVIVVIIFVFQLIIYFPVAMYQWHIFSDIAQMTSLPLGIQSLQTYLLLSQYMPITIIINLVVILLFLWILKG